MAPGHHPHTCPRTSVVVGYPRPSGEDFSSILLRLVRVDGRSPRSAPRRRREPQRAAGRRA